MIESLHFNKTRVRMSSAIWDNTTIQRKRSTVIIPDWSEKWDKLSGLVSVDELSLQESLSSPAYDQYKVEQQ